MLIIALGLSSILAPLSYFICHYRNVKEFIYAKPFPEIIALLQHYPAKNLDKLVEKAQEFKYFFGFNALHPNQPDQQLDSSSFIVLTFPPILLILALCHCKEKIVRTFFSFSFFFFFLLFLYSSICLFVCVQLLIHIIMILDVSNPLNSNRTIC